MAALRRNWRLDLAIFLAVGVAITLVFANGTLDIASAKIFYRADPQEHWPLGGRMPWSLLYRSAPWITGSLVLGALAVLALGWLRKRNMWRQHAIFVLLSVVVGPGLLVNFVFKDHWERPRPRDIVEFAGQMPYAPAPLRGEGGKSFPCGHCSVGFLYGVGWWIWRRRHPAWAVTSLAIGLFTGAALGIGRLAAGGHFVSDTVWSAFLAFGVAHLLYCYVLNIPAREAGESGGVESLLRIRHKEAAIALLAAAGGVGVLIALFVTPHGRDFATEVSIASLAQPPKVFEVRAPAANVEIVVIDHARAVSVQGELHGFGLPASRLELRSEFDALPQPTLRYRIEQSGWFTDLDASMSIRLPAGELERIVVRLERGNVKVTDATTDAVVKRGRVQLDLRTGKGTVRSP